MTDHETALAAWVLPLAGEARAGVDARYDAAYEQIRAELAKLDAVSAPPVDWEAVRLAADTLLRARSKDLFVAAALARALHVADGLSGLTLGLALLARLAGEFGSSLYPTRARARVSALNWLAAQVARALADTAVVPGDRAVVIALQLHFDQFLLNMRELLGDDAPSFSELRDAVARMLLSLPPEASTPAEPTPARVIEPSEPPAAAPVAPAPLAPPAAASTPGLSLTTTPPAPSDAGEVASYLKQTGSALAEASRLLWRADRTSPVPYRLLRTALWLHLECPSHDAAGTTSIPAPEPRLMESLPSMLQHGKFAELLEASEAALPGARFWLDLHFFCDRALEGLGPAYASARAAASAGARALVERMPALSGLSFSDETRLAGPETRAWLEQLTARGQRAGADAQDENGLEDLRVALRGAAAAQALKDVEDRRRTCGSARQRFLLDLEVARALSDANRLQEARALYEALDLEVQQHGLEAWEPALSLQLLTAYLRCLQRTHEPGQTISDGVTKLRVRVAKLSPVALVSLGD